MSAFKKFTSCPVLNSECSDLNSIVIVKKSAGLTTKVQAVKDNISEACLKQNSTQLPALKCQSKFKARIPPVTWITLSVAILTFSFILKLQSPNPQATCFDTETEEPDTDYVNYPTFSIWPDSVIPYTIDCNLDEVKKDILQAMEQFHQFTCVKFVERTDEEHYAHFIKTVECSSDIGLVKQGKQLVNLGEGCHGFDTIIHELGHLVGLEHEHQRSDRDTFVKIFPENIEEGNEDQFVKKDWNGFGFAYDMNSIMHYKETVFSKNDTLPVLETLSGVAIRQGKDGSGLSDGDIEKINFLYSCI